MKTSERLSYIDVLKFLGIFILLFEHTGNWTELGGFYNNVKTWICSYHMPLFFIAYGLAVSYSKIETFEDVKNKIVKRAKRILVPYILWSAIYAPSIGIKYFLGAGYGTNTSLGWSGTNAVLWFLPAMFIAASIDAFFTYKLDKHHQQNRGGTSQTQSIAILMIIEAGVGYAGHFLAALIPHNLGIWFSIDIAIVGCAFINAGKLIRRMIDWCSAREYKSVGSRIAFEATLCLVLAIVSFIIANHNQPKGSWVTIMAYGQYGRSFILFFLNACVATCGLIIFSQFCSKVKWMSMLGGESLFLMAFHYILFQYTIQGLNYVLGTHSLAMGCCLLPLLNAIIVSVICIPVVKIVKKFLPILL